MSTKIGLRVYQMTVRQTRAGRALPFATDGMTNPLPNFVKDFVEQHARVYGANPERAERDRHWYFDSRYSNEQQQKGLVRYGISGFESDIVDANTNNSEFRRQTTHVEIIPLFYEFWFPRGFNHGFAAFQSFAARSCIELVSTEMRAGFTNQNPGFMLHFRKLLPTGASGIYDTAPVKGLRLVKRNAPSDIADRYLNAQVGQGVNFQIVINARRKNMLGFLGDLTRSMNPVNGGVVQHEGVDFDEAIAEIDFGGKRRRVGIFGFGSEAGVIDLTDIKRGSDGHPSFASISQESTNLLKDFQSVIGR